MSEQVIRAHVQPETAPPDGAPGLQSSRGQESAVEITGELVCVWAMRRLVMVLSACLLACGDNQTGPPELQPDAGFAPAPHAALPSVFEHTGAVLSEVQLVTITFAGYDITSDVVAFGDAMVASD